MEILFIAFVFLAGVFLGSNIGAWLKERELGKKILSKENVVACFKDVDWGRQTFSTSSGYMETPDGCKHFYKVHSIDRAIEKLNTLLVQSPANNACTRPASAVGTDGESDESAGG